MRFFVAFFAFLLTCKGFAQELPPVTNFDPAQYEAGNQNWMISQAENKNIYFANDRGLLEYTGDQWNLYAVPNETVVRAVKVVGDLIFTGAYMEVGFWEKNPKGVLEYTSLVDRFPGALKDGQQFWHIEDVGDTVVFQSFEGLYLYNIESGKISEIPAIGSAVTNLFKVGEEIFFQMAGEGLFNIENKSPNLVIEQGELQDIEVMGIFRGNEGLFLVSQTANFYKFRKNKLNQFNRELSAKLSGKTIFSALQLQDGDIFLGTVENGVYHTSANGEIIHHFNQENDLLNNTVLNLFNDSNGNIWAGLDNGLGVINTDSPFKLFRDHYGRIGTVYASFQNRDYLYLGTNQGLYYRKSGEEEFNFIEGSNGQVWSLQEINGTLFSGHNRGTFVVEGTTAKRIADRFGTWIVKPLESDPRFLIQGHYNGISLLKKEGDGYLDLPMLEDFPHSSKFIVSEPNGNIWIGNEHKGVFKMQLNESKRQISEIKNYTFSDVSGISSSLFHFNDSLYFATKEKIFQYKLKTDSFSENNALSEIIREYSMISGKFITENDEELWAFSNNTVLQISPDRFGAGYSLNPIYLPQEFRNTTLGYENIAKLETGSYLLGITNGFLTMEEANYDAQNHQLKIDKIVKFALDEEDQLVNLSEEPALPFEINNLNFYFSIPGYKKFLRPSFSYRLHGLSSQWSDWIQYSSASYKNLPFGEYEFQVRGKLGDEITPTVTYNFEIDRPWYFSYTALALYFFLFGGILFSVHKIYKKRHQKTLEENEKELRMKNLEAEQEIIKLKNEQLEQEMIIKNKELAISTMSIVKKNEFLTNMKDKLQDSGNSSEVKLMLKTIDKEISEEDTWNFFKKAFSNADKDFFRKIKAQHPELTSNDLKLCAYLRLNLSSKEIAPLLNISVKSVEIKRYRLRKKMELPHEVNLTDYILQV